jgi:hypothetical protein
MFWEEEQPKRDGKGKRWHFQIWMDSWAENGKYVCGQRLFFWSDDKSDCGVIIVEPAKAAHVSRLRNRIKKLVSEPEFRRKYRRELRFPLERYYREWGAFPEEISN